MWNLIFFLKDTNELIYKTETDSDTENKLNGYQRGNVVGVINQELGMNTRTPLYIRHITQRGSTA